MLIDRAIPFRQIIMIRLDLFTLWADTGLKFFCE